MTKLNNVKELLETAKKISKLIVGEKHDSLELDCMNYLGIYSTTVNVGNRFSKWVRRVGIPTMKFNAEEVYSIKVFGIKPIPKRIDGAVYINKNQIILDLSKVLDQDTFRLEVAYRINNDWLSGIVKYRSSPEPLEHKLKYNLSAQLKDPSSLIGGFSEFDVEEYPVSTNVQIQESINTNMPSYIKQLSKIDAEILSDYTPYHGTKVIALQKKRAALKRLLGKEDMMSKLKEIYQLLTPSGFLSYINRELEKDFRLHRCEWGTDVFKALGMMILPRTIEVISRTDLTLKKPAASGAMVYEKGKFSRDVKNVFE